MFITLITTVTGVCLLFVGVMIVIAAIEKRMERERANLMEGLAESIYQDRKYIAGRSRVIRMSKKTLEKLQPEATIAGDEDSYPLIGYFQEYQIHDAPELEIGAYFFGHNKLTKK